MISSFEILPLVIFIFLTPQLGLASADSYWQRPISPQQSHYPENCGSCHNAQYDVWKDSLHSKAMSPGLMGQLNPKGDPEFANSCYFCHAPLTEQSEVKAGSRGKGQGAGEGIKNPSFDNKLKLSGVSCSVCHLREGKVYGPTVRQGQGSRGKGQEKTAHDGFIEKDFFEQAEFCAACHQMDEGYELNGKVLTNTYREWKESIYGKNNITCQSCHMPDRQHLFRGIHDPEMVKRGVEFNFNYEKGNDKIIARLTVSNTGVGHFFPTYATPLVVIKGSIIDNKGSIIKKTLKEAFIGRKVSLNLEREYFDTRIPPKGVFNFEYENILHKDADRFIIEVRVYPDKFYNEFYKAVLKEGSAYNKELIKEALKLTEKSVYTLYKEEISLKEMRR
ncbi:MAG: multiheme c-type cytochrome [Nitrospirota bacterium]